ncbi:MAG: PSP1 domain-containing protein [Chitinivibrionales bacterium]
MSKNEKLVQVKIRGVENKIYRKPEEIELTKGDHVILETEKNGLEIGEVVFTGDEVKIRRGKGEIRGVVRLATEEDIEKDRRNRKKMQDAFKLCKERILKFKLEMKLVDVSIQFDGSKMTFFFTAAHRVDFRELVKDLASIYRTRIELRQIGVRDETKRRPSIGICGRETCCSKFLNDFDQISTQMAKNQQLSLNPSKISGNCGRLLCCLKYEEDKYIDVFDKYPELQSPVKINGKKGELIYINIFKDKGQVKFSDGSYEWYEPEELRKGVIKDDGKEE